VRSNVKEGLVRFLVATVAVIALIVAGHTIQTELASSRSVESAMISGISVYQLHLNKPDMKTLPEQEAPLP
jgi:hypothetical protein